MPGLAAICPHANTEKMDDAVSEEEFIERDLEIVERCDAILMLPGYEHSQGAIAEMRHAVSCSLPVFSWDDLKPLRDWAVERQHG